MTKIRPFHPAVAIPARAVLGLALLFSMFSPAVNAVPVAVPPSADARIATTQIRVLPDRADWTYATGQTVRFHVHVTWDNQPLAGVAIRYSVGPEMAPLEEKRAQVGASGLIIEGGTMLEPGFIRCYVQAEISGRTYRGVATAGFSPEKIEPSQTDPGDFDAFWGEGLARLSAIPIEARETLMPEACTADVNVYHVSFRNVGGSARAPARVYGILSVPKAPGRYPALLILPGAGVSPFHGKKELASRGVVTLQIGIHGIPVNLPPEVYEQLRGGALKGYQFFNLDDRESYYYRRVYLGCVRANDYLTSRAEYDGKNLLVTGDSQGGQLSIVTAALDPRVKGLAAYYPAYSDVTGYLHGRAGGWPHMMRPDSKTGAPSHHAAANKIAVSAYYDVVNFSRRLKVPTLFTWGYNDDVCPVTSLYAAYNVITAPKRLLLALETGHNMIPEQVGQVDEWLLTQLGAN